MLAKPEISIVLRKIIELNFRKQKEFIKEYLLPLSTGDRVIDAGCGTGEFSTLFPSGQYTGIDIDEPNLTYARKHFQGEFIYADATRLPFPDASFSRVLIVGMLHHLNDADAVSALQELARVLTPGGRALIMEDTVSRHPLTRLLHWADQGSFIRTEVEWVKMVGANFTIKKHFTFYNSICLYTAFFLMKV